MRHIRFTSAVLLLMLSSDLAFSSPIQICYKNDTRNTLYIVLKFDNGYAHQTLQPRGFMRRGGDTEGTFCVSTTYVSDPDDCPDGGYASQQNEIECRQAKHPAPYD